MLQLTAQDQESSFAFTWTTDLTNWAQTPCFWSACFTRLCCYLRGQTDPSFPQNTTSVFHLENLAHCSEICFQPSRMKSENLWCPTQQPEMAQLLHTRHPSILLDQFTVLQLERLGLLVLQASQVDPKANFESRQFSNLQVRTTIWKVSSWNALPTARQ